MTYRTQEQPLEPDRSIIVVGIGGHVVGLDRQSGDMRWKNALKGGGIGDVFLAINYGVVIASAMGDTIYCLDYLTGVERWRHETRASGRATIVMEPDHILCAKGGYIDCFTTDGTLLWTQPLKGYGIGGCALGYPGNVVQSDDVGRE